MGSVEIHSLSFYMKLNFSIIETNNPQTLLFVDESKYTEDTAPVFPTLQVKFPNIERVYKCLIRPEKLNSIYTNTLGFSLCSMDYPDGVYTLKYSCEPHNTNYIIKKYMKVSGAYKKLKEIVASLTNKDDKYLQELSKINLLLLASQLEVESNEEQANEYLKLANKLINKLDCNV